MTLEQSLRELPRTSRSYYRLVVTGGLVCRELVGREWNREPPAKKRGRVSGFSAKSRKRFLALVNSLDVKKLNKSVFITLTYGARWPKDGRVWKAHLKEFLRKLFKEIGKKCIVWKLEYQKRGAPHYHLVVLDAVFIPHGWIAEWWENTIKLPKEQRGASTHVCKVRGGRNALFYVAGYLSKQSFVPDGVTGTGRVWGVRYKKKGVGKRQEFRLSVSEYYDFVRFARKYARHRGWKAASAHGGYKHTFMPHEAVARWVDAVVGKRAGIGVSAAIEKLDNTQRKCREKTVGRASGACLRAKTG